MNRQITIVRTLLCCAMILACLGKVCAAALPEENGQLGQRTTDRMAGWNYTIVSTNNTRPNSCFMTYQNQTGNPGTQHLLAKLVPGVEIGSDVIWTSQAREVNVRDISGAVLATYRVGSVKVRTEIIPLLTERGNKQWDGVALYKITTTPATPLVVRCGGGRDAFMHWSPVDWVVTDSVDFEGAISAVRDGIGFLHSPKHPLSVCIKSSGEMSQVTGDGGAQSLLARFAGGSGTILLSFAKDDATAQNLVKLNPETSRKEVNAYYSKLLSSSWIETPEKNINAAYRTAIYNLEYNWVEPFGWVEGLHHWVALWHQQHTGGAEWLGQADRSRQTILETAARAFSSGALPHLSPAGLVRREYGGSNQFFSWEVRHYWAHTGDLKTIREVAPVLYKAIDQTFEEYDSDNDGLLNWGLQIGNQEDFVLTPYNGTAPTIEGINMLRTGAIVARATGDAQRAEYYDRRARMSLAKLRSVLWKSDLGRFIYYVDPFGVERLDGEYETSIYPVIWNVLDPLDSWTSIRHLRDRLIGKDGEVYVSNWFPNHMVDAFATWGMQAGAEQQPWGAFGLSAVGLRNETYRPLKAVAGWVMNDFHKGAWPEVGREQRLCYYSPPAGQYVQAVVEALFGLEVHQSEEYVQVAPSFPDSWPSAKFVSPGWNATYSRRDNTYRYVVESPDRLSRRFRWMLPPGVVEKVLVDGKKARYSVKPGVECIRLEVDTEPSLRTNFSVTLSPLTYKITAPSSIAEGDEFHLNMHGLKIEQVDDRCGIFSSWKTVSKDQFEATVKTDLLKPYEPYGKLGQMTFSRRTFFLLCRSSNNIRFWVPVDITILPAYEVAAIGEIDGKSVNLILRNNTFSVLKGQVYINLAGRMLPFMVNVPSRSERQYSVPVTRDILGVLSPGDNSAHVVLPGDHDLDLTIVANKVFSEYPEMASSASARMVQIPLPESALVSSDGWKDQRKFYSQHAHWRGCDASLAAIADEREVTIPALPEVKFRLSGGRYALVSRYLGNYEFTLDLGSTVSKKLYLLVCPLIDNHDMYSPIARVSLLTNKGVGDSILSDGIITRTLYFPGDLDWWYPSDIVGNLATYQVPRANRFELLPILSDKSRDWDIAKPPVFPQPQYWATCLPFKTKSSVLGVVEVDLPQPTALRSVTVSALSADAAIGVVAVDVEKSTN